MRTKTLVKAAIVQVDAHPFKQWYLSHYGVELGVKSKEGVTEVLPDLEKMEKVEFPCLHCHDLALYRAQYDFLGDLLKFSLQFCFLIFVSSELFL